MGRMGAWEILTTALHVRRTTGKPALRQFYEMHRLRRLPTGARPVEYYAYRLFDDRMTWEQKGSYVSEAAKPIVYSIQDRDWLAMGRDKLLMYAVLSGLSLPHPRVHAVYHPSRTHGQAKRLTSVEDVEAYLRSEAPYPFFSKPSVSYFGYGGCLVRSFDPASDRLLLGDGTQVGVREFVRTQMTPKKGGTLLQELIEPHPALEAVCGRRASTIRMLVLNGQDGPELFRAVWRVPTGRNMVDNFRHGASGNMLGHVSLATGKIGHVLARVGLEREVAEEHPDTKARLNGFMLPDWEDARQLVLRAAASLPGLRLQSWDVALSARGPLLVEVNTHGDFDLLQHTHETGLGEERWQRFLAEELKLAKQRAQSGPGRLVRARWQIGRMLDRIGYNGPRKLPTRAVENAHLEQGVD